MATYRLQEADGRFVKRFEFENPPEGAWLRKQVERGRKLILVLPAPEKPEDEVGFVWTLTQTRELPVPSGEGHYYEIVSEWVKQPAPEPQGRDKIRKVFGDLDPEVQNVFLDTFSTASVALDYGLVGPAAANVAATPIPADGVGSYSQTQLEGIRDQFVAAIRALDGE